MNFLINAGDFITKLDILGPRVELNFKNNNQFKTIYGLILSLSFYTLCIIITIPTIKDYLYKQNPKTTFEESVSKNKTYINNTNLEMFVKVLYWDVQKNNGENLKESEIEENPKFYFVDRNNQYNIDYSTLQNMVRCKNLTNFEEIINKDITNENESINSETLFLNTFCFPANFTNYLETRNLEDRALVINFSRAFGKLSQKYQFLVIQLYYKDILLNLSNDKRPYSKMWSVLNINLSALTYYMWNLIIRKYEYQIEPISFLFKSERLKFEELQVEKLFLSISSRAAVTYDDWNKNIPHCQIYISKNSKQSTNYIKYVSFEDCLASFGGIFSILLFFLEGIASFLLSPLQEIQQINSIFRFHYHSDEIIKKEAIGKKKNTFDSVELNNLSSNLFITKNYCNIKNANKIKKISDSDNEKEQKITSIYNSNNKIMNDNSQNNTNNEINKKYVKVNYSNLNDNFDSVNRNLNYDEKKSYTLNENRDNIDCKSELEMINNNNLNIEVINKSINHKNDGDKTSSFSHDNKNICENSEKSELNDAKSIVTENFNFKNYLHMSQKERINQYLNSIEIINNHELSSEKIEDDNDEPISNKKKEKNKIDKHDSILYSKTKDYNSIYKILDEFVLKKKKEKVFTLFSLIKASFKSYFKFDLTITDKILLSCIEIQSKFQSLENLNNLSLDNLILKQMISDEKLESLLSFPSLNFESEETENLLQNLSKQNSNYEDRIKICNNTLIEYSISLKNRNKILGNYLKNFL